MRALSFRRFVAVVAAFVVVFSGNPQAANAATCSATTLVPNLTRFEINQGLGSYDRLTRGKAALVRAYFSLPDSTTCTLGTGQALNITGATLGVVGGGSSNTGITAANAAGFATSAALSARPALVDSSHDPFFAVSGSILAPSSSTVPAPSFSATFTVNVTYTRKLSSKDVTTGLTASFSAVKTVDQESKAIRILFQPLGDISATGTIQFTDSDRTSVVNAVQTLLRVLPVPAGPPGSLRPPIPPAVRSGGIRYEIVPSLMDVKSISGAYKALVNGTTGFCATQSVFVALAPTLGAALDTFNSLQAPEDAADLIVGVYGEEISGGSPDGCALGMASPNGKVSIARAVADKPKVGATPAQVSQTGAVMAQEIMHNFGAQPSPRSATFHSSYTQADNTDPDGAYNLAAMTYIAGDKTIMNVNTATGPWDNNVTVLEQPDNTFALCRFGGSPLSTECTAPDPGGTLVGVAASDSYLASGDTMNGVSNAYYGTSAQTADASNSLYRLLQLKATVIQSNKGIPVSPATTHGDGALQPGIFTFALPRSAPDVDETRIVKLNSLTDDPLGVGVPIIFRAVKNPAAPNVVSVSASDGVVSPGGATLNFTKNITPPVPAKPGIYFLADTTSSMGAALTDVKCKVSTIIDTLKLQMTDLHVGAGDYKDFFGFGSAYAFNNAAPFPDTGDGIQTTLDTIIGQTTAVGASLPTSTIASTLTQGGAPNFADTFVTPYVLPTGCIISWTAQFSGGNLTSGPGVPAGIQLKVLRPSATNPDLLTVVAAGQVHDPRPALQARFGTGYPFFATGDSALTFLDSLDVQSGDRIGLTISSDPAVGGYFYPLLSATGDTRLRLENVAVGGTIDLTNPFTGTLTNQAPAVQVNMPSASSTTGWKPAGGGDTPEAQLFALQQIAAPTTTAFNANWRSGAKRIVVWFGDEPGHDPICTEVIPTGFGVTANITETTATNALVAGDIAVNAVSVKSPGLDGNPVTGSTDYTACGTPLGTTGQATRIAGATGGIARLAGSSTDVAQALLDSLLFATVTPQLVSCDTGLTFAVDPSQQVVRRGTGLASFNETVTVASSATPGDYSCVVEFLVNGKRVMAGETPDPAFQQVITVSVGSATAVAEAKSYNGAKAVADFIYKCPGSAAFPVATSVKPSPTPTELPGQLSSLTFAALIDPSLVPGGKCTLTTLVSDLFERSSPTDPGATTTITTVTKAPVVEIYTPGRDQLFTNKAKIFATGWGTDPDGGALTFGWTLTGPSTSPTTVGFSGPNVTFGPLAVGDYTVTFTGTETGAEHQVGTATRTITILPESSPLLPQQYSFNGFFPPANNWPLTNQVNAGQAFTAKWTFRDNSGQDVTTDGIFGAQLQQVDCSTRAAIGAPVFDWQVGATMIRYDAKGQQWIGNVNIPLGVGNCYTWTLELKDGSLHPLFLQAVR